MPRTVHPINPVLNGFQHVAGSDPQFVVAMKPNERN
jgi:hypothetical protein